MTLEKAIEYQKDLKLVLLHKGEVEYAEATQLGIEALKGIKKVRKTLEPYVTALLPGETQD